MAIRKATRNVGVSVIMFTAQLIKQLHVELSNSEQENAAKNFPEFHLNSIKILKITK